MYVIHYHNEHQYDNPGMSATFGPYNSLQEAKNGLEQLVKSIDDPDFKIDPDPYVEDHDGTYAGFFYETLSEKDRDEDLVAEIWAEIIELTPPSDLTKL